MGEAGDEGDDEFPGAGFVVEQEVQLAVEAPHAFQGAPVLEGGAGVVWVDVVLPVSAGGQADAGAAHEGEVAPGCFGEHRDKSGVAGHRQPSKRLRQIHPSPPHFTHTPHNATLQMHEHGLRRMEIER